MGHKVNHYFRFKALGSSEEAMNDLFFCLAKVTVLNTTSPILLRDVFNGTHVRFSTLFKVKLSQRNRQFKRLLHRKIVKNRQNCFNMY